MLKKSLALGIVAGILAGIASLIYSKVYHSSNGADFSKVARTTGILAGSLFGTLLAGLGYYAIIRALKGKGEIVFNLLFAILSFASIVGPIGFKLPLDMEAPELFPGLTIPMHFFPLVAWHTLKPLFFKKTAKA
ncbi:MAG: hypothetical protein P4L51_12340 [Puia sp.]|nr:hypothetical protein [Puia sp.]